MRMMRRILGDRSSATAIAVLAAYFLLLQAVAGGWTRGTMAAEAADHPLHSLCMASGAVAGETPSPGGNPAGKAADCPCASLCRLASMPVPAILSGAGSIELQQRQFAAALPPAEPERAPPPLRGFLPESRAPPVIA